jgi:hypothetical protein
MDFQKILNDLETRFNEINDKIKLHQQALKQFHEEALKLQGAHEEITRLQDNQENERFENDLVEAYESEIEVVE